MGELRDILPENNQVKELVPQILTSDPVRFVETAKAQRLELET